MSLSINNKQEYSNALNGEDFITESYNAGTGANRVLVIFFGLTDNDLAIQSATYNGVTMTVFGVNEAGSTSIAGAYLLNPAEGANNLVVTFGNDTGYIGFACYIQSDDMGIIIQNVYANTGNSATPNVSGVVGTNEDTIAILGVTHDGNVTASPDSGETEEADFSITSPSMFVNSQQFTSAGAINLGSTVTASDDWQGALIVIAEGTLDYDINVSDSITITENLSIIQSLAVNLNDSVSIVDYLPEYYEDQLFILDVVTVEIVVGPPDLGVNLNDAITLTESLIINNTELGGLNISDQLTIAEDVSISNPDLGGINVNDTISLTELINLGGVLNIATDDSITLNESSIVENTELGGISVFDSLSLNENLALLLESSISVFDSITLTENLSVLNTELGGINVNDNISISELISLGNVLNISTDEAITISESVQIENLELGGIEINDVITSIENISTENELAGISVFDEIAISEDLNLTLSQAGILFISINDSVSLSENLTILNTELGNISIIEPISLTESIVTTGSGGISIVDEIQITDNVAVENTQLGNLFLIDSLDTLESLNQEMSSFITVNDPLVITEIVQVENTTLGGISITESIDIDEVISLGGQVSISIIETVVLSEEVIPENQYLGGISVYDIITLSELIEAVNPFIIIVDDAIGITESIQLSVSQPTLTPNVSDTITISEDIVASGPFNDPYENKPENIYEGLEGIYKHKPEIATGVRVYRKKRRHYRT